MQDLVGGGSGVAAAASMFCSASLIGASEARFLISRRVVVAFYFCSTIQALSSGNRPRSFYPKENISDIYCTGGVGLRAF